MQGQFHPATVVIGPPAAVADASDKYATMLRLKEAGVPVPRFTLPDHHLSPETVAAAVGDHALIKPRVSRGSRGVREIHPGRMSARKWGDVEKQTVVQECAPGAEYAPMIHLPRHGGEAVVVVVEKFSGPDHKAYDVQRVPAGEHPEVTRVALTAAQALGLTGPVDVDVRRLADGSPAVLEVNARFGANSALAPEILDALLAEMSAAPTEWDVP